jgi:hypothetical protein
VDKERNRDRWERKQKYRRERNDNWKKRKDKKEIDAEEHKKLKQLEQNMEW